MNFALIGPGILPIPPDGWGAVESLIWDYSLELDELGHTGIITNTQDWDEIIKELNCDTFDFAHLHYDVFFPLLDRIAEETKIKKIGMSSHYPYIDQPHMHRRDGYDVVFDFIVSNQKYYIFCISKKDYDTFKKNGANEDLLVLTENGANHKRFTYQKTPSLPNKSLYLGQIYHRKKQWLYQEIKCIDFVGKIMGQTPFDPLKNYLGEWSDEYKREHFTDYGNLILLSDGENGTPLVVKEALINGLGVVISKYAAHDLTEGLPYVTVIPDDKLENISYVKEKIEENREVSLSMRDEIREYAINNFSWESLVKLYSDNIEKLKSNAN
jgi:glycosyltransferase involved in cell wall biosynthesis